jgi:nickel/cobalt transporter (NicO) family protein
MSAPFHSTRHPHWAWLRTWLVLLLASCAILTTPGALWAHPLGNFTVNRYSRLEVSTRQVLLTYVIDMAEIPTQQEVVVIDQDRNGEMSEAEQAQYLAEMVKQVTDNAHLLINNRQLPWRVLDQQVEFPPGQADLPTLRLTIQLVAELPAGEDVWQAEYIDDNYADRLGWREVIVQPQAGVTLLDSSAPDQDISDELRRYPEDLLQSPPSLTTATFRFAPAAGAAEGTAEGAVAAPVADAQAGSFAKPTDRFAELITIPTLGPGAILLALLAAFGWGALHALSPGHGKTIVAAYLVGSRGTAKHALFLGLTTTITHTAGVFVLGFVTLFLSRYILPEVLYPWLGLMSGLLVVAIGLSLVWGRLRGILRFRSAAAHPHDHTHPHEHSHGWLDHDHSHGDAGHSHLPPQGNGVTWRGLLALGISGGLIPCPSALVLMLGAIALDRVPFGLVLILVFSIGLASVLTAIGIALVYAGRLFDHLPESGRLLRLAPVASAAVITLVGVIIAWQALVQTGVLL